METSPPPPLPISRMHEERANFAREALEAVRAARLIQAVLAASQERDAAIPRDPVAILREEARVDGWESLRAGAEAETDEAAMQHWLAEQRELTNQMNAMYNNQDGEQEEDEARRTWREGMKKMRRGRGRCQRMAMSS